MYMLLDFVCGGDFFSNLRAARRFAPATVKHYAGCIVLALDYIHSRDVVYRDLKCVGPAHSCERSKAPLFGGPASGLRLERWTLSTRVARLGGCWRFGGSSVCMAMECRCGDLSFPLLASAPKVHWHGRQEPKLRLGACSHNRSGVIPLCAHLYAVSSFSSFTPLRRSRSRSLHSRRATLA